MRSLVPFALLALCSPAEAADVTLSASLVNSCVLSLTSQGTLTPSSSGTTIGSEEPGGSAASVSMTAIGLLPTISFGAPGLTSSPPGWSASPTVQIRYTSSGGANQGYTSSATTHSPTGLLESYTVHGRVQSATGFAAGSYTLRTVVTCQQ
jgi:hypothetical protein